MLICEHFKSYGMGQLIDSPFSVREHRESFSEIKQ